MTRHLLRGALLCAAAALPAIVGCVGEPPRSPTNLLLVTLDTTSAAHLGCYGSDRAQTPHIDRLAADGFRVARSVAVSPITLPSHASLLTGRYPPAHGVRDNGDYRLPGSARTLAEHLGERGYATAGVVGAYVLSADFGIAQGFDRFDEPDASRAIAPGGRALEFRPRVERTATEVTDTALAFVDEERSEPFFLWVHYYDPHAEYRPPAPFDARFAEAPYDGEIAYTDQQLGRLLDELERRGLLERTLVVVTADHGESLGAHDENTHGLFVYDATIAVPLLFRLPGRLPAGGVLPGPVSGVDVAPTLLELLGQPGLPEVDGISFAAAMLEGVAVEREPAYAETLLPLRAYGWSPLHSLQTEDRKFIEAPLPELYDLADDPGESRNLAPTSPAEVQEWRARLDALRARWPDDSPGAQVATDPESRAKLAALGYVSTGPTPSPDGQLRDPKTGTAVHNAVLDAQALLSHGQIRDARVLVEKVLERDPANPAALGLLGALLCTSADSCAQGLGRLEEAAARAPGVYEIQHNLANALHLTGRPEDAARAYRAALALHPFSASDRFALGNVLQSAGDPAGAIVEYREAIGIDPGSATIHAALGVALAASGDPEAARGSLERAVTIDPGLSEAWNQLGILAEKQQLLDEAQEHYRRAVEADPGNPGARFNAAKVALRRGDPEAAARGLARLLEVDPDHPAAGFLAAHIALARGDEAAARAALDRFLSQRNADPGLVPAARELRERLGP